MLLSLINTALICASLFDSLTYTNKTVQQYHIDCNKAITYKVAGDYQNAIKLYENAFKTLYPFHEDIKRLLDCYYQTGQKEKYQKLLKYAEDQGYYNVHSSHLIFTYEATADKWQKKYFNAYDTITKKTFPPYVVSQKERPLEVFEIMECIHQVVRSGFDDSDEHRPIIFRKMSDFFVRYLESNHVVNRNESRIWEDFTLVVTIVHMIENCEADLLDKFILLLWKEVDKGNLYPMDFATICGAPRPNIYEENFFGTAMGMVDFDPETLKLTMKFQPIHCSREELQRRRDQIAIPSIDVSAKIVNAQLDF